MVRLNDTSGSYVRGSDSVSDRLVALLEQPDESQRGASSDAIVHLDSSGVYCLNGTSRRGTDPT